MILHLSRGAIRVVVITLATPALHNYYLYLAAYVPGLKQFLCLMVTYLLDSIIKNQYFQLHFIYDQTHFLSQIQYPQTSLSNTKDTKISMRSKYMYGIFKKVDNFYSIQLSLIIRQQSGKSMTDHDKLLNRRIINQQSHNRNLDHTIKSLQDQIQLTIYNYENILQTEKKNSSERSDFLLYLIQSLRTRHLEELETMTVQIQNAEAERQSVQTMQKQMENIGDGLDQIMDESQKLKAQNDSLTKQLEEEENKEKQLDEELELCHRELQDCRMKVDDWERMKIKWNRHKKQMIEMIEDAEKAAAETLLRSQDNDDPYQKIICSQTGLDQNICDHCQKHRIEELRQKYSNQFRKST